MSEPCCLYLGEVAHRRARPKRHALHYSVFMMLLDVEQLEAISARFRLFSVGRFNLFSLLPGDVGTGHGIPLGARLRQKAEAAGIGDRVARIRMLCFPRLFGYAFNPLTTYYLEDAEGRLLMVLFEVHNTFGEQHVYEAMIDLPEADTHRLEMPKCFYVSPFNTLAGDYRFVVRPPGEEVLTAITLTDSDGPLLTAHFRGRRREMTDGALVRLAIAYPLMTLKVIAGIHWEALRLWLKGVPTTLKFRRTLKGGQQADVSAPQPRAAKAG